MNYQLRRIIDLVKKTGDKMVVVNYKKPQDSFVVMDLFEYENLVAIKYDDIPVVDMDEDDYYDDDEVRSMKSGVRSDYEDDFYDDDEYEDMESDYGNYLKDNVPVIDMSDSDYNYNDYDYGNKPYSDFIPEIPEFSEDDLGYEFEENLANNSEDFEHIGDILDDIDKNDEYGKIEHSSSKRRWSIPIEIKEGGGGESIVSTEDTAEDDRYYFENI